MKADVLSPLSTRATRLNANEDDDRMFLLLSSSAVDLGINRYKSRLGLSVCLALSVYVEFWYEFT